MHESQYVTCCRPTRLHRTLAALMANQFNGWLWLTKLITLTASNGSVYTIYSRNFHSLKDDKKLSHFIS